MGFEIDPAWAKAERRRIAEEAGFEWIEPPEPEPGPTGDGPGGDGGGPEAEADGLPIVDVGQLAGVPVPERRWCVKPWMLQGALALLSGPAGANKSTAAQQWASAIAVGADFMGTRAESPMPALVINAEDSADEMHRRQFAISRVMGRTLQGFAGNLFLLSLLGRDAALGHFEGTRWRPSPLVGEIEAEAARRGIKFLVLDNVSLMFTGNENDRAQVNSFCGHMAGVADRLGATILLIGHTPKNGAEWSGSTGWTSGVRTRLYMHPEQDAEGRDVTGSRLRYIRRSKTNFAAIGETLAMAFHEGALVPADELPPEAAVSEAVAARNREAEEAFLAALRECRRQQRAVHAVTGRGYAPAVLATMPAARGFTKRDLVGAMERLLQSGRIVARAEMPWRTAKREPVFGLAEALQ